MKDLNAFDIEQAIKIIAGSARSMGVEVKDWCQKNTQRDILL
jgi:large subunit ribosomal protein L11